MMETLFVTRDCALSRDENTIRIDFPDGAMRRFPVEGISHIVCLNSFTVTSKLLELFGRNGVRVSFFNHYGIFRGAYEPLEKNPSGAVVLSQAALIQDEARRLDMAKAIVTGSGRNAINLLKKVLHNKNAYDMEKLSSSVASMERLVDECSKAKCIPGLMGREGVWRSHYYSSWEHVYPGLRMGSRVRRPPNNPVNTLLSFLNQMLFALVLHQISKTHLHPSLSVLHSPAAARCSLALDIAEVFRPVIVDRLLFKWFRTGVVKEEWFRSPVPGVCLLEEGGLRSVVDLWRDEMEVSRGGQSWTKVVHNECNSIERFFLHLSPSYRPFLVRS